MQEEDNFNIDQTELFLKEVGNRMYKTFEELQEHVYNFEKLCGVLFRRGTCHKFPEETQLRQTVVYKSVIFVCVHYGTQKDVAENSAQRMKTFNCRASFTAKGSTSGICVTKHNLVHNHHILKEGSAHLERCRHLTENQTNAVVKLMALGTPNHGLKRFVNKNCNIRLSKKQVYSLKHRLKKKYMSSNQISAANEEDDVDGEASIEQPYLHTRIQDIADMLKKKTNSLPPYLIEEKLQELQRFAENWVFAMQLDTAEKFQHNEFTTSRSHYSGISPLDESDSPFPMPTYQPLGTSDADDAPQEIIQFNLDHLPYMSYSKSHLLDRKNLKKDDQHKFD